MIQNGTGTPTSSIVLNKKGITISSQGAVTFDAKGGNLHFEVTGEDVLIEKITFRNFNFTEGDGSGGAILWIGNNGILKNCKFINNTANIAGAISWSGVNGAIITSTFIDNIASMHGGAISWQGHNSTLTDSIFINNTAGSSGGAVSWSSANSILNGCTFTNNTANLDGGGVIVSGHNSTITSSTFTGNFANRFGGGIYWYAGANGILTQSIFTSNSANNRGGAVSWFGINGTLFSSTFSDNYANEGGSVYWQNLGSMINNTFFNSKSHRFNGIYATNNLNINGGKGIVYVSINGALSGISIVVLNNETYYYPPNSNINFKDNNMQKEMFYQCMNIYSQLD